MSVIGESVDLIKASKEWKDEYEKKHDVESYIFRITDLNNKLCKENLELMKRIKELEEPNFVFTTNQFSLCENILIEGPLKYESALFAFYGEDDNEDEDAYDYYKGSLEIEELKSINYIIEDVHHELALTNQGKKVIINEIYIRGSSSYSSKWINPKKGR